LFTIAIGSVLALAVTADVAGIDLLVVGRHPAGTGALELVLGR
jgi:hypothetical protein